MRSTLKWRSKITDLESEIKLVVLERDQLTAEHKIAILTMTQRNEAELDRTNGHMMVLVEEARSLAASK
jgi:hypothetical protein